jgi:hypothetical protein
MVSPPYLLPTTVPERPWLCPSCGTAVTTPFCPGCGERPISPVDLSLRGIAAQLMRTVGGLDSRVMRSLRELLLRPGALTLAYVAGRRKPYIGPFQLFLLANIVFFIVQSLTHTRVFSSPLDSHLHQQDWSALAGQLVAERLHAAHTTLSEFAPLFDRAVVLNAKALIVLMVVPLALLLPLVFPRRGRPWSLHVVFALHFYAFALLLFSVGLGVALVDQLLGGGGLASARVDNVVTGALLLASAVYVYLGAGRVYPGRAGVRVVQAIVVAAIVGAVILGYRFAIFLITLYTT